MDRLFGIETEYGIILDQDAATDPVTESIALIKCYRPDDPTPRWDYSHEDPMRDARGFRADQLLEPPTRRRSRSRTGATISRSRT